MALAVEMSGICKRFPGVLANDNVSIQVETGEIHGLIGENGAGKSTLMNILYGLTAPDSGTIRLFGGETRIGSSHMAIEAGIGMVHQHFMLMPNLTVLQNIILGRAPTKRGLIDKRAAKAKIQEIMDTYNLPVDMNARIFHLSVGEKQRVEIIKALYRGARILILDEPTAVLTPGETDKLLDVMRRLKNQGCSIIFITHKLREVMAAADRITVMRKGAVTGVKRRSETNARELSTLMVGREVDLEIPRNEYAPGGDILSLSGVRVLNRRGLPALRGVSFSVKKGEIVGIAGVEGNGQTELIEVVAGMLSPTEGSVVFKGVDITRRSVRQRRELGMGHIPEDRLKMGIAVSCTIRDNLILNKYYRPPYAKHKIMDNKRLGEFSDRLCEKFQIKTPGSDYLVSTLSGGNMQKVVFAREKDIDPDLLIAAQPTRGVDIGAIEYIHHQIMELRDAGKTVLLVSAELDEILSLSDRILVMYEGEITGQFTRGEADERAIGEYMTGALRRGGAGE